LQSAGYATAHFGKWHLSNNMIPDSPSPGEYGYDTYGAFNCSGEQMPVHEDARNAISFMEESLRAGKPFFINLWMHEPHTPFHTVPKYRWRFRDSGLEETDEIYASVLSHADDRIGEVLDTLDRLELTDNTLVIFSSDNGPARSASAELTLMHDTATGAGFGIAAAKGITAGRKGYKAALFEGGINVPFIARWPGNIAAGNIDRSSMISGVDLLPTFREIAGVPLPDEYQPDGVSQLASLTGKPTPGREKPLFWKMAGRGSPRGKDSYHWVSFATVDRNWKLLTNNDQNYWELYDIVADPYEKNNLADAKPEIVPELNASISEWRKTLPAEPSGNVFSNLRNPTHPE
jgi:N-acetylgalactosamine-6-sulfatase